MSGLKLLFSAFSTYQKLVTACGWTYLYVEPYHPVDSQIKRDFSGRVRHYTRTQRAPKYYFIDFGLSRQYDPREDNPLEYPIFGGDKPVPEFQNNVDAPVNPFPTDVYYLGNVIREEFMGVGDYTKLLYLIA